MMVLLFLVPATMSGALRINEADAKRAAIQKVTPAYPPAARQLKISGTVAVEASVDTSGKVQDVKVTTGNPVLGQAVVAAVKQWKFKPFEAGGSISPAVVTLSFDFRQ